MKKIALFSFAFAALSLASCKKTRTCTCSVTTTSTTSGAGASSTSTSSDSETIQLLKASKRVAKSSPECMSRTEKYTDSYTAGGTTFTIDNINDYTCTIK